MHYFSITTSEDLSVTSDVCPMPCEMVCFIPPVHNAAASGKNKVIVLSNDTDVLVALPHFCTSMRLSELWTRVGVGNTTRYIPLHTLAEITPDICSVLPAIHTLVSVYNNYNKLVWDKG